MFDKKQNIDLPSLRHGLETNKLQKLSFINCCILQIYITKKVINLNSLKILILLFVIAFSKINAQNNKQTNFELITDTSNKQLGI